jgi:hypothetical protein
MKLPSKKILVFVFVLLLIAAVWFFLFRKVKDGFYTGYGNNAPKYKPPPDEPTGSCSTKSKTLCQERKCKWAHHFGGSGYCKKP